MSTHTDQARPADRSRPSDRAGVQEDLTTVHLVSLGCARNDVDSEELAARLEAGGFRLVAEPEQAEAVMVNTCGFVESAKKDSVDTLLAAADLKDAGTTRAVVAVGCLAERYGRDLAESLPEADAVLGFDDYADVAARLQDILAGGSHTAHAPRDRRALLPISPVQRPSAAPGVALPGHGTPSAHGPSPDRPVPVGAVPDSQVPDSAPDLPVGLAPASGPRSLRRRLGSGPMAPLKIASGCDRRCTFCAIPSFRGAYVSRSPDDVVAEAQWLAGEGVRELFLVSENSSSYGKDLGDIRAMESMLGRLAAVDGIDWVRVSYLQPAETRASLVTAMTSTEGVVPYFDLSFQHAAPGVLRRMRRFGDPDSFLALIDSIRAQSPTAGIRSNVIVGFPGETEEDLDTLLAFLEAARLDAVGVFGYSDEDGTAAAGLDGHLPAEVVEQRREAAVDLATELMDQRAEDRIGETVQVLLEERDTDPGEGSGTVWVGRAAHQGPEVDGCTRLAGGEAPGLRVGRLVAATVVASEGPDLLAEPHR